MSSPLFPEPPPPVPPTPLPEVDAAVARVKAAAPRWLQVSCRDRAALLQQSMDALLAAASQWATLTNRNRGLPTEGEGSAEPWLTELLPTMRNLRLLRDAMAAEGQPRHGGTRMLPSGQLAVQVMPTDTIDRALFAGMSAEIWIEPGRAATQGEIYRDKAAGRRREPKVALVLGAGNVGSITPTDALYKLFVDDEVVVVKTNPVNAYLAPVWDAALRPFTDAGYIAIVHGGAEVGAHLCNHSDIANIHVTGSDRTHDAIVWGTDPEEVARRKAAGDRKNPRPVSSELGCVTPVMVVPGRWSDSDLRFQAQTVAGAVTNNASFNCVAAKVLVVSRQWPQKDAFVAAVRSALAAVPNRKAYYPGAEARYEAFLQQYKDADVLTPRAPGVVPWTMLPSVPARQGEYALCNEAFCGVLAVVELDAAGPEAFLSAAVTFANDVCWGNLSCSLIIDGATEKAHKATFERAIADLRFGGVAVNIFSGIIFGVIATTWGAFPGNPDDDIQSGKGVVHNTYLLDHPQKSVLRAPFRIFPPPVWFAGHRGALGAGKGLVAVEHTRSWLKVPHVAVSAVRA